MIFKKTLRGSDVARTVNSICIAVEAVTIAIKLSCLRNNFIVQQA